MKMSKSLARVVGVLAVLVVADARGGWAQAPRPGSDCDFRGLGSAVAVDTSHLRRQQLSFPWEEATEGASVTVYSAHAVPKVLVLEFLGETGRNINRYYLIDEQNFVLERDELRYAAPTDVETPPRIISRLPTVVYVCSGVPQMRADSTDFERFTSQLDSALSIVARSMPTH